VTRVAGGQAVGERTLRVEAARVVTERDRQRRDAAASVHEAVEPRALLARFLDGLAHHDERARQDLEVLTRAAELRSRFPRLALACSGAQGSDAKHPEG
jgi:hypothetical protein